MTPGPSPVAAGVRAVSSFEVVEWQPDGLEVPVGEPVEGSERLGQAVVRKRFTGHLEGTSTAFLLLARGTVEGSDAYVGLELFTGRLDGRAGSFVLQHCAVRTAGRSALVLRVVPDSGTGDLEGLEGEGTIEVAPDGAHRLVLDCTLAAG